MPTRQWEFEAVFDDSQVKKALEDIQKNMRRMGKQGDRTFRSIGSSSIASGIEIGLVSGVVSELTSRLIDSGVQASRALGEVVVGGVRLNEQLETTQRALSAAFGDPALSVIKKNKTGLE